MSRDDLLQPSAVVGRLQIWIIPQLKVDYTGAIFDPYTSHNMVFA